MMTNYYRSTLRERLKNREQWIADYLVHKKHDNISKKVTKETQGKVPLASILLKIYFLPTIILNFFYDFRNWYYYNKCTREIQIIKEEIKNSGSK